MAAIAVKTPTTDGSSIGFAAAASGGDYFVNDGRIIAVFKNNGASSRTVTHTPPNAPLSSGTDFTDIDLAVGAGETHIIGPFKPHWHNDENGRVQFTYSSEADILVSAVRIGS